MDSFSEKSVSPLAVNECFARELPTASRLLAEQPFGEISAVKNHVPKIPHSRNFTPFHQFSKIQKISCPR